VLASRRFTALDIRLICSEIVSVSVNCGPWLVFMASPRRVGSRFALFVCGYSIPFFQAIVRALSISALFD